MKNIVIFLGMLVVFLTGCGYKYADSWQPIDFRIEDAYSDDPGVIDAELEEILEESKGYIEEVIDRRVDNYLLWQNFDEVEILRISTSSESNMLDSSDAYYNRKDNTIYVKDDYVEHNHEYTIGTVCHELIHVLTWTEKLDSMLSEGVADLYAARIMRMHGMEYEDNYINQVMVALWLEACYPEDFLNSLMTDRLSDKIDHDLGKVGAGEKLNAAEAMVYYYGIIEPDQEKCHAAILAQFDILAHLAAKTRITQDMAIDLVKGYNLDQKEEEYFIKIIKAR